MQIFFVIVAITAFIGGIVTSSAGTDRGARSIAESQSTGSSLRIFANAVASFVAANPSVSGPVDVDLIGVPYWFAGKRRFSVIVEGGRAFIFVPPGEVGFALTSMAGSARDIPITMGIVRNHQLVSPNDASHSIAVPSGVPEGALLYVM